MSKLLLLVFTGLLTGTIASAQQTEEHMGLKRAPNSIELNLTGGVSLPMGAYAGTTGRANTGFNIGLDGTYNLLANNRLGISIGFGYQQHKKDSILDNGAYSFNIKNGYTELYQKPNPAYRQFGLYIGPVYKVLDSEHWSAEVRLRVGFVNINNPDYYQVIWAQDPNRGDKPQVVTTTLTAYNYTSSVLAFMPGIGTCIHYRFTPRLALRLSADYYRGLGENGEVGSMERNMKWNELINNGLTFNSNNATNILDYASVKFFRKSTPIQVLNMKGAISLTG